MHKTKDYRPDIDGLRAIAIIAVILSHLKIDFFSGGYIGVDVFFVISGFLITKVLLTNSAILKFYRRRALRIIPALVLVLSFTYVFSTILLFPGEWQVFLNSFYSTIFFISNIHFQKTQGYFGAYSETKQLLHCWSLAVEEQFYIFYPIILYFISRFYKQWFEKIIWLLILIFFVFSCWLVNTEHVNFAFYSTLSRAWELLIGAACALRADWKKFPRFINEILGVLGLTLILFANFSFTSLTSFPGYHALFPCLGAALIIYSSGASKTLVNQVLSSKPLVYIGLISYSLYLWHWPIYVFTKLQIGEGLESYGKLAIIIVSFVIASCSRKYIENPFLNNETKKPIQKLIIFTLILLFSAFGFRKAYHFIINDTERTKKYTSYLQYQVTDFFRMGNCFICAECNLKEFNTHVCLKPSKTKKNVLLLGDSHAAQLWYGFYRVNQNINLMQDTITGCRPLLNTEGESFCVQHRDELFYNKIKKLKLDSIILAARWSEEDLVAFPETIKYLKNFVKDVYVVGPINEYNISLPKLLIANERSETDQSLQEQINLSRYELNQNLQTTLEKLDVIYLSHYQASCPKGPNYCVFLLEDDIPLQFDYGHLTMEGSIWVVNRWKKLNLLRLVN